MVTIKIYRILPIPLLNHVLIANVNKQYRADIFIIRLNTLGENNTKIKLVYLFVYMLYLQS